MANITGTESFDILFGTSSDDLILGLGGDDRILGFAGNDTIDGGTGNDNINGDDGNDIIDGGDGNDTISGDAGTDTIRGGAGDDIITLTTGDMIDGGSGNDIIRVDLPASSISTGFNFNAGNFSFSIFESLFNATITNVENVDLSGLTNFDDVVFYGPTYTFSTSISGRNGNDTITGGSGSNSIFGEGGNDTLIGGSGSNRLDGGAGNDTLIGGSGSNRFDGGAGDDIITGNSADDTFTISDGTGSVTINVVTGTASGTTTGNDQFSGIERFNVFAGSIDFTGDDQANFIQASAANATLRGGNGNDIYIVQNANAVIIETATGGTSDQVFAQSDYTLPDNVENLSFELFTSGNFALTGNGGNNVITGNRGNNVLTGGAGNDRIVGGGGTNILIGGAGNDTLIGDLGGIDTASYAPNVGAVVVDLAAAYALETGLQTGTVTGGEVRIGLDSLSQIENVTGSAYGDRLYGDNLANVLSGGAGDDIIYGEGGADTLVGGDGSDALIGGLGIDVVDYSTNNGAIFLDLSGFALETGLQVGTVGAATAVVSTDSLTQIENVIGTAYGDRIYGAADANRIESGAGDDIVYAEGGNDIVIGGAGSDILLGGSGVDTLDYSGAVGAVFATIDGFVIETALQAGIVNSGTAALSTDLVAQFENLTGSAFGDRLYGDAGANVLSGLAGDDILYGGDGADTLVGGDGIDRLIGEAGADILTGGLGADRFLFSTAPGAGVDTVTDFNKAEGDQLFFLRSAFGLAPAAPLTLVVDGAAVSPGSFLYNSTTGLLSFDADGAGGAAAVDIASIGVGIALAAGDLVLYG